MNDRKFNSNKNKELKIDALFKKELLDLYLDATAYYYIQGHRMDYNKLIAFGAWGEIGENYFLFIYRDAFERDIRYGAILFIHKPNQLDKPVHTIYFGIDGDFEHRNVYSRTAAYYLKNQSQNTMSIEGENKKLYQRMLSEMQLHTSGENDWQKQFDELDLKNASNQKYQVQLLEPKPIVEYTSPEIREKLKILRPDVEEEQEVKKNSAMLGLSLAIFPKEFDNRKPRFQPIIVPIKRDGTYGIPKPAIHSQIKKYQIQEIQGTMKEFIHHLHELSENNLNDSNRIDAISQIYFNELSNVLHQLPEDCKFYQRDNLDRDYFPLKTIKFKKLELFFAPFPDMERYHFYLKITDINNRLFKVNSDYLVIKRTQKNVFLFFNQSDGNAYYAIPENHENFNRLLLFLNEVKQILLEDLPSVQKAFQTLSSDSLVIHKEPLSLYHLTFKPIPILKVFNKTRFSNEPAHIEVQFDYDTGAKEFLEKNQEIQLIHYKRNKEFENLCYLFLKTDPNLLIEKKRNSWGDCTNEFQFFFKQGDDVDWLLESSEKYLDKGFKIYSSRQKKYIGKTGSNIKIKFNKGINWFEFKPLLENSISGEVFEIAQVDFDNKTITDKKGVLHLINPSDIERLAKLSDYAQQQGNTYRVPSANFYLINILYEQRDHSIPIIKDRLDSIQHVQNQQGNPIYPLSESFSGELREYQQKGFQWLSLLHTQHLSGCLADDMGLGKTVQTLALLQSLKTNNQLNTSILIVPVSVIPNWEMEIQKFCPSLKIYRHMGTSRIKDQKIWADGDLVITSYATLRNDIEIFKEFLFDYIILDESQTIKNFSSQVTKAIKILKGNHRLALSGTPIENSSMELWSLMDFLLPGFLGSQQWFRKEWAIPVEKYKNVKKTEMLKQMISPFILRRKKEEVEKDLPLKNEFVELLDMEDEQIRLYADTASYYQNMIANAIDEKGVEKSSLKILEGMLRLRQICLFPQLANPSYQSAPSVKFHHLKEMLEDIISEKHKVLIFSQFVKVLSILKEYLDEKTIKYCYIDGSVEAKKRGKIIKSFQQDKKISTFLLSLKAGGVGINLTAADYVIIFDPWWNPAVEAQAIDRAHRIGQNKKVFVYRLVVKDTIEEKMLALQQEKRELMDKLITTSPSHSFKNFSKEEILNLFKIPSLKK